jgi:hypothetical protein
MPAFGRFHLCAPNLCVRLLFFLPALLTLACGPVRPEGDESAPVGTGPSEVLPSPRLSLGQTMKAVAIRGRLARTAVRSEEAIIRLYDSDGKVKAEFFRQRNDTGWTKRGSTLGVELETRALASFLPAMGASAFLTADSVLTGTGSGLAYDEVIADSQAVVDSAFANFTSGVSTNLKSSLNPRLASYSEIYVNPGSEEFAATVDSMVGGLVVTVNPETADELMEVVVPSWLMADVRAAIDSTWNGEVESQLAVAPVTTQPLHSHIDCNSLPAAASTVMSVRFEKANCNSHLFDMAADLLTGAGIAVVSAAVGHVAPTVAARGFLASLGFAGKATRNLVRFGLCRAGNGQIREEAYLVRTSFVDRRNGLYPWSML